LQEGLRLHRLSDVSVFELLPDPILVVVSLETRGEGFGHRSMPLQQGEEHVVQARLLVPVAVRNLQRLRPEETGARLYVLVDLHLFTFSAWQLLKLIGLLLVLFLVDATQLPEIEKPTLPEALSKTGRPFGFRLLSEDSLSGDH
jgi:hypothetical protein